MYWIWDVEIPVNLTYDCIMHYKNKSKAASIILSNKREIKDLELWSNLDFQMFAIKINVSFIQYIKDPSEEVHLAAVKISGDAIEYIKDPSKEVQLEAIKQNEYSIQHIKDPSEKVQLEATRRNGFTIQYIKNPSKEVQLKGNLNNNNKSDSFTEKNI